MIVEATDLFIAEARIASLVDSIESGGMEEAFGVEAHEFNFFNRIKSPLTSTL
jgi:cyclopropane fatty-acyl-phospholipid synthase-like methyltransferase